MEKIIRSKTYVDADYKTLNSKVNSFVKKIAREDLISTNFQINNGTYAIHIMYMAEVKPKVEASTAQ